MQRFTITLSYEEGRKLGLVLVCIPIKCCDLPTKDEENVDISPNQPATAKPPSKPRKKATQPKAAAEPSAKATAKASAKAEGKTNSVNNKRKRPTRVCISPYSIVFLLMKRILELNKNDNEGVNDSTALLELGRKRNVSIEFRNGNVETKDINEQVMKLVLAGTIKSGDVVEKIELNSEGMRKDGTMESRYTHIVRHGHDDDEGVTEVVNILKRPDAYPLSITLARPTNSSSPRKRTKLEPKKNGANSSLTQPDNSNKNEGYTSSKEEKALIEKFQHVQSKQAMAKIAAQRVDEVVLECRQHKAETISQKARADKLHTEYQQLKTKCGRTKKEANDQKARGDKLQKENQQMEAENRRLREELASIRDKAKSIFDAASSLAPPWWSGEKR